MKHQEGSFKGARGTGIFYQSWLPDTGPKAALVIVHGLCTKGERADRLSLIGAPRPDRETDAWQDTKKA